ncbi:MAG: GNAT family N-acetyltransferase [Streptosporangiaceae bacterium]
MNIGDLERIAARHWQAPDIGRLGEWWLRAAGGFTGRANSALPVGDPGMPLPEAVDAVEAWYSERGLPPMIVLFAGDRPHPLEPLLAERAWVPRQDPAFVMTAAIADILSLGPAADVHLESEPDEAFMTLYRYRGQDLPPIAHTLLMSSPWQAFGSIRRDGRTVAVGRVSVADGWAGLTAIQVDASCQRQGLGRAISIGLAAAAAEVGVRNILLQVGVHNAPARALYFRCGFQDSHRYRYLLAPS